MSSEYNLLHWELIYKLIENSLSKKEDIIVAVVHTILINSGFKCIGLGNCPQPDNPKESENLPGNWNVDSEYSLRYLKNGKAFTLNTLHVDDELIVSFLSRDDCKVKSIALNISSTVAQIKGDSISALIPDIRNVVAKIESDIMESERSMEIQTDPTVSGRPASRSPPSSHFIGSRGNRPYSSEGLPLRADPFDYGRSDLNPFGSGGGMIFDPMGGLIPRRPHLPDTGVPGIPRGSVPPGARFDPFGPSEPNRPGRRGPNNPNPDPDHLPPPGYDDMFM